MFRIGDRFDDSLLNIYCLIKPATFGVSGRERAEDVPALARHFAQRAAIRFGLTYVEPSTIDLQSLMHYSWPGNIRELGAVIDRAVILGGGRKLEVTKALGFSRPTVSAVPAAGPTLYEVIPESEPEFEPDAVRRLPVRNPTQGSSNGRNAECRHFFRQVSVLRSSSPRTS